jgi:hypothetical protein
MTATFHTDVHVPDADQQAVMPMEMLSWMIFPE